MQRRDAATGVDNYPLRARRPGGDSSHFSDELRRQGGMLTELRAKQQTEGPTWGIGLCEGRARAGSELEPASPRHRAASTAKIQPNAP